MKKSILFLSLFISGVVAFSQYKPSVQVPEEVETSVFYLDLSSGIDNHTGLIGLGAMIPIEEKFALRGGAGLGSWGLKFSGGLKYGSRTENGFGFGLGYSYCPGLEDMPLTFNDATSNVREVVMDLNPVGTLNFTVNYNFVLRNEKIIFLETGYAVPTGGSNFYTVTDGGPLTEDEDYLMQIIRPGGLILAMGLQFGF